MSEKESQIRLHLGCGQDYLEGYVNIDLDPNAHSDMTLDFNQLGEAFEKNSVSEILMIHSINYLRLFEAQKFFRTAYELLTLDGTLIIETPNLDSCLQKITSSTHNMSEHLEGVRGIIGFGLDHLAQEYPYQPYAMAYSPSSMSHYLHQAGFEEVESQTPQTHAVWRDMRIVGKKKATTSVTSTNTDSKSLVILSDSHMGHATQIVKGKSLLEEYENQGWNVEFIDIRTTPAANVIEVCSRMDFIYLLKVADFSLIQAIKGNTKGKIVFDLADALWQPTHRAAGWQNLEQILSIVDAIFYENEFVGAYGKNFNNVCHHIPVVSNVEKFSERSALIQKGDKIRIGWVGSPGTLPGLLKILPGIIPVFENYQNLEIVLLGTGDQLRGVNLSPLPIRIIESYDENTMIDEILGMHIGLFPIAVDLEDFIMRGAGKALLYMQGGCVPIAWKAGECEKLLTEGVNGILVKDDSEWPKKITYLLQNPELLTNMSEQAKIDASKGRSKENIVAKSIAAFKAI